MSYGTEHLSHVAYLVPALTAQGTHVPQLLSIDLRRRTLRPLVLCAIAGYGLLCLAVALLAFAVSV